MLTGAARLSDQGIGFEDTMQNLEVKLEVLAEHCLHWLSSERVLATEVLDYCIYIVVLCELVWNRRSNMVKDKDMMFEFLTGNSSQATEAMGNSCCWWVCVCLRFFGKFALKGLVLPGHAGQCLSSGPGFVQGDGRCVRVLAPYMSVLAWAH